MLYTKNEQDRVIKEIGKTWVIIVHWGDPEVTRKCIESVKREVDGIGDRILVVENGSPSLIKEGVQLLFLEENKGFAGAVNAGIANALSRQGEYFLVLNNDIVLRENILPAMLSLFYNDTKMGIVGAVVEEGEEHTVVYGGGKIQWPRGRALLATSSFPAEKLDYIAGSCFLVSHHTIEKAGYIPESYFLYWEDVAYSMEVKRKGLFLGYISPRTPVLHLGSQGLKESPEKTYYLVRNGILWTREYAPIFSYLLFFTQIPLRFLFALFSRKEAVWRGILDGCRIRTGPISFPF